MHWYLDVLKKYVDFSGRAQRQEYWMFVLFNIIIGLVLGVVEGLVGMESNALAVLYSLAVLLPGIAVGVRRLHDTGRTGLWLLFAFVPLIGWLVLLFFFVTDSQPGSNAYGPNPKG